LVAILLSSAVLPAQIKSPQDYLGFRVGEDYKLADWQQITGYFAELGKSSDRVRVILGEEKLHGKTAVADVPVGSGRVILLSIRSQLRAQVRATYKLLFNSIYYGSASLTIYEGHEASN
jgi:hypothetical protein